MLKWLAKKVAKQIDLGAALDLHSLKEEVKASADYHAKAALQLSKSLKNAKAYLGSDWNLYIGEDGLTKELKKRGYTKVTNYRLLTAEKGGLKSKRRSKK